MVRIRIETRSKNKEVPYKGLDRLKDTILNCNFKNAQILEYELNPPENKKYMDKYLKLKTVLTVNGWNLTKSLLGASGKFKRDYGQFIDIKNTYNLNELFKTGINKYLKGEE